MSDQTPQPEVPEQDWPTHCPECGTEMASAVVDMDKANADRPELRPGEMARVDYCPNPDCSANKPEGWTGPGDRGSA